MKRIHLVLALLACLPFSGRADVTQARVVVVKGSVTSTSPSSSEAEPAVKDQEISVGSTIGTASNSSVLMEPNPGSVIKVLEKSKVKLAEDDLKMRGETVIGRKTLLDLRHGSVMVALPHPSGGGVDFKIKTPQCVAAARGTIFWVITGIDPKTGKHFTEIIVLQSTVEVNYVDSNGQPEQQAVTGPAAFEVFSDGTTAVPDVGYQVYAQLEGFGQEGALAISGDTGTPGPGDLGYDNTAPGPNTVQGGAGASGVPGATGVLQMSGTSITIPPETQVTNR